MFSRARIHPGRKLSPAAVFLLTTLMASASAPVTMAAAPEQGTPLEVAAGVPGSGREWELVTSEEPVSAFLARPGNNTGFLAPSGNRIIYTTLGKLPDAPEQEYVYQMDASTRGNSGWENAATQRPDVEADSPLIGAVDSDLGEGIVNGFSGTDHLLLRVGLDGSATTVVAVEAGDLELVGASTDLRRVYFSSSGHLVPDDAGRTSGRSLYESGSSGIRLVDGDAEGHPISACGSEAVTKMPNGGVSADGRRIYFEASPGCTGSPHVFLGGAGSAAIDVSASRCDLVDCGPEAAVALVAVDPSGSKAVLKTTERLTDADTDSNASLYEYDAETGSLTLLTPSAAEIASISAVQITEDGSKVFFVGRPEGQLSENLYRVDAVGLHLLPVSFTSSAPLAEVQLSADGGVLAISTAAALCPEDTDEAMEIYRFDDPTEAALCPEDTDEAMDIYRFDDPTEELTLLTPGNGEGRPARFMDSIASMILREPAVRPFRAISADGSRIFFTTAEPLVPQDGNELDDVYEWHDGSLSLVSSGAGDSGSFFSGTVRDGSTAFFVTADTLLPRDRDGGARDIYAARIGGGFPEASTPAPCSGEACRNAIPPPGSRPISASSAEAGKRIRVGRIATAARRRMAATGWIDLLLEATRAGRLSAVATARIGERARTVAKRKVRVKAPGPLHLRMRLSRQARAWLATGRKLRLRLRLREGKGVPSRRLRLVLGGRR